MKKSLQFFFALVVWAVAAVANPIFAQDNSSNYKHPYLNASGHVLDSNGSELGWITKEGIINNAKGEKVGFIQGSDLLDANGKKLGHFDKNGTYYNNEGAIVFTIDSKSKGEQCKVLDPQGKVIATFHESYKNQACAIHCLYLKMPMK